MTLKIWTSWTPAQTQQWRGQTNGVQTQNLTTIKNCWKQPLRGILKNRNSWKLTAREFIPQQSWRLQTCNYTKNEIHHSLFQRPRRQVWNSQLQYRYLYYYHRTDHLLLDGCFLKLQKSTFKEINNKKIYIWKQPLRDDLENDALKI